MIETLSFDLSRFLVISTSPRNLTPGAFLDTKTFNSNELPDFWDAIMDKQLQLARDLKDLSFTPAESILHITNSAYQYILALRDSLGLKKTLQLNKPEIFMLDTTDTMSVCEKYGTDFDPEGTGAFVVTGINDIYIIAQPDLPDYLLAGQIAHEMIHLCFDKQTVIYSQSDGEEISLTSELRRSGLVVYKVDRHEGYVISRKRTGIILHELANYAYEFDFVEDLLSNKDGFGSQGICARDELLDKFGIKNGVKIKVGDSIFSLSVRNVHYTNSGDIMMNNAIVMSQLADELDAKVRFSDGMLLSEKLLLAKSNPSLQPEISKSIDKFMGKGFYRRMKIMDMKFDEIIVLLVEVQNRKEITS